MRQVAFHPRENDTCLVFLTFSACLRGNASRAFGAIPYLIGVEFSEHVGEHEGSRTALRHSPMDISYPSVWLRATRGGRVRENSTYASWCLCSEPRGISSNETFIR